MQTHTTLHNAIDYHPLPANLTHHALNHLFDGESLAILRITSPIPAIDSRVCRTMPNVSVEIPQELLDEHVEPPGNFVNPRKALRASIRKTLDIPEEIVERHGWRS